VGAGIDYFQMSPAPAPNRAYVVRIDRSQMDLSFHIGFPSKTRNYGTGRQSVSHIASLYDTPPSFDVIAAVNGSFFDYNSSFVTGSVGSEDDAIDLPETGNDTIAFTDARDTFIDHNTKLTSLKLKLADSSTTDITVFNSAYVAGALACYTNRWASRTGNSAASTEIILNKANLPFRLQKEVGATVSTVRTGTLAPNNFIPSNGFVLSASGAMGTWLAAHAAIGQTLTVQATCSNNLFNNADAQISGHGWILKNGVANTGVWPGGTLADRNPRTALAWNSQYWYMIVIDGRSAQSLGMTFQEMADFFVNNLQATDAINLDGGGSSDLVLNGSVMNHPSDGSERLVGNSVMLVRKPIVASPAMVDSFPSTGRQLAWDDKLSINPVYPVNPAAPGGDGYAMVVSRPAGGIETTRIGKLTDADYAFQAYYYCDYRPSLGAGQYERGGIFARDNGNSAYTSTAYGASGCYTMSYESDNGRLWCGKIVNGVITDLLPAPVYIPVSGWHRFTINCVGSTITWYNDGVPVLSRADLSYSHGFAGIGYEERFTSNANIRGARVDNVVFTPGGTSGVADWSIY
jgi:hypothetical protein